MSTGDESGKSTFKGALTEPKRALVKRSTRIKMPVSMRRSRDNLLMPSTYPAELSAPSEPTAPPETWRQPSTAQEPSLPEQNSPDMPMTQRGGISGADAPLRSIDDRALQTEENWSQGPATRRGGISSEIQELSPDDLESVPSASEQAVPARTTQTDSADPPSESQASPQAVNDPGGTQPLGLNERPTIRRIAAAEPQALETQLDDVLAKSNPPPREALPSPPEVTVQKEAPTYDDRTTPSLEASLEHALSLGHAPALEPPQSTLESHERERPVAPAGALTSITDATMNAAVSSTGVVADAPLRHGSEPELKPTTETNRPQVHDAQLARSARTTTPPTRARPSIWQNQGVLITVSVLILGALAWISVGSKEPEALDAATLNESAVEAVSLEKSAQATQQPSVAAPEAQRARQVKAPASSPGPKPAPRAEPSAGPKKAPQAVDAPVGKPPPPATPRPVKDETPPASNPSQTGPTSGEPVTAPMNASTLTASDRARLPADLKPVAVIYLMQELAKRMNNCHRGGRTNGTVDVLFTFLSDGKVADAKLIGEPVASAPVSKCLLLAAKGFKLPTKNGEGLRLRRRIRLR